MKTKERDESLFDLDTEIEDGFNKALSDVQESIGEPEEKGEEVLEKAKAKKAKPVPKEEEEDEPEEDEDEEDEEEKNYRKSIEDRLAEEPEAEAAMDVEPFLRTLVKSVTDSLAEMEESVTTRFNKMEVMVKSQGRLMVATAKLQKSIADTTEKIGKTPIPSGSLKRLEKSRFGGNGETIEVNSAEVLAKSFDWLREKKIDLTEAGNIERRVNRGLLGTINDPLDAKVQKLLKEDK